MIRYNQLMRWRDEKIRQVRHCSYYISNNYYIGVLTETILSCINYYKGNWDGIVNISARDPTGLGMWLFSQRRLIGSYTTKERALLDALGNWNPPNLREIAKSQVVHEKFIQTCQELKAYYETNGCFPPITAGGKLGNFLQNQRKKFKAYTTNIITDAAERQELKGRFELLDAIGDWHQRRPRNGV